MKNPINIICPKIIGEKHILLCLTSFQPSIVHLTVGRPRVSIVGLWPFPYLKGGHAQGFWVPGQRWSSGKFRNQFLRSNPIKYGGIRPLSTNPKIEEAFFSMVFLSQSTLSMTIIIKKQIGQFGFLWCLNGMVYLRSSQWPKTLLSFWGRKGQRPMALSSSIWGGWPYIKTYQNIYVQHITW